MKSLIVRFNEQVSTFETTHKRLKDISELLGVSQNKAMAYAINKTWEQLDEHQEMQVELTFRRRGVKIGDITYLNHDQSFMDRVKERIAKGIPQPHEDDESLESNLLFRFLSKEQQDQVRAAHEPADKRNLIATFIANNRELPDEEWGEKIGFN